MSTACIAGLQVEPGVDTKATGAWLTGGRADTRSTAHRHARTSCCPELEGWQTPQPFEGRDQLLRLTHDKVTPVDSEAWTGCSLTVSSDPPSDVKHRSDQHLLQHTQDTDSSHSSDHTERKPTGSQEPNIRKEIRIRTKPRLV